MRRSTVLVSVAAGMLTMLLLAARPTAAQTKPEDAPAVLTPVLQPCGCLQVTPEGWAAGRERQATNIVSVIAGAQIPSTPASLVPDALAPLVSVSLDRVLGEGRYIRIRGLDPRWSSVQVNGDRLPSVDGQSRATPLDILPAEFFDEMAVSRTLTADLDGDAIGGIVNLVPRRPTEQMRGSMSLSGGYRGLRGDADNVGVNGMIGRRVRPRTDRYCRRRQLPARQPRRQRLQELLFRRRLSPRTPSPCRARSSIARAAAARPSSM